MATPFHCLENASKTAFCCNNFIGKRDLYLECHTISLRKKRYFVQIATNISRIKKKILLQNKQFDAHSPAKTTKPISKSIPPFHVPFAFFVVTPFLPLDWSLPPSLPLSSALSDRLILAKNKKGAMIYIFLLFLLSFFNGRKKEKI